MLEMDIHTMPFPRSDQNLNSSSSSSTDNRFECDAVVAREALNRENGVNYDPLIEIFTCRKSSHVLRILQAYLAKYKSSLELEISSIEPPHPCQKILIALAASHKAHKAHGDEISQHIAQCDAKRLYQAGEGKAGPMDQSVVVEMFSKRSIAQLKLTFLSYKHIYGHSYTSFLKKGDLGDFEGTVRVVVKCICNPPKYYAQTLYECLMGTTTDQGALMRILVNRAGEDMDKLRSIFVKKFGVELKDAIFQRIPDGNDRDFLVALVSKESKNKSS